LTSRNEGDRLRRTVDAILRSSPPGEFEIVIIDDASSDGSAGFTAEEPYAGKPIRSARNDAPRGLIFGRARGADMAAGSHLVFLDAHCTVSDGWLDGLRAELDAVGGQGIVVPVIQKLRPTDWTIDRDEPGAEGCTISSPFLDFAWTDPLPLDGRLATCTIGGGAWMCSSEWYRHIGGLDRGMRVWGGENIDVPLRTWLAGGSCVVARDVEIGHLYNEHPTVLMPAADFTYNKMRVAHNVFSAETFRTVMRSLRYLEGFQQALSWIHEERHVLGVFKDFVESRRKRPDSWLIETFRLPLREPPFFYLAPRRLTKIGEKPRRPPVAVVVTERPGERVSDELLEDLLGKCTYANSEVLLVSTDSPSGQPRLLEEGRWRSHPRLRFLETSTALEGGAAENLAATASNAEWLAFLPPQSIVLDESWLERLLLLAEKRPRLVLACPRTTLLREAGDAAHEDIFDAAWDWDAPGFTRETIGTPVADGPYQALSVPDRILFLHRKRFLDLGGFDWTVKGSGRPILDLAIRAWLSGLEVLCDPGIRLGLIEVSARPEGRGRELERRRWLAYGAALAASKSFTGDSRILEARKRCAEAEPLIRRHGDALAKRRQEQLERAEFDDDWLFYKFEIEDPA
jgi:glycosyltransferase involved in cell wall biosynthesis